MIGLCLVFGFISRALPRLLWPHATASDTYFHLYYAQAIRDAGFRIPAKLPRVALPHRNTSPWLYHWLLALLPPRLRLWAERLTAAVADGVATWAVYLFCSWAAVPGPAAGPEVALWTAWLYAFSPALLRVGSGPRAYSGTPRVLGELLYLGHVLLAYYGWVEGDFPTLAASAVCGGLLLLTSKFPAQVFVGFGLFFALFLTPGYLLLVAASLAVAMLVSRGNVLTLLDGHIRHSSFYRKRTQAMYLYPHRRSWSKYREALRTARARLRERRPAESFDWFFSEQNVFHVLLTAYPQIVLALLWALVALASPLDRFLAVWAGAGLALCFLTKCKPLLFLGEGERYLEHALAPILVLAVKAATAISPVVLPLLLGYELFAALWYWRLFHRRFAVSAAQVRQIDDSFALLDSLPIGTVLPIGPEHWQTLCKTKHPVLTYGSNIDERFLPWSVFQEVLGNYPYPCAQWQLLLRRYDVRYVVSNRAYADEYFGRICENPREFLDHAEPVVVLDALVIYRIRPMRAAA